MPPSSVSSPASPVSVSLPPRPLIRSEVVPPASVSPAVVPLVGAAGAKPRLIRLPFSIRPLRSVLTPCSTARSLNAKPPAVPSRSAWMVVLPSAVVPVFTNLVTSETPAVNPISTPVTSMASPRRTLKSAITSTPLKGGLNLTVSLPAPPTSVSPPPPAVS